MLNQKRVVGEVGKQKESNGKDSQAKRGWWVGSPDKKRVVKKKADAMGRQKKVVSWMAG